MKLTENFTLEEFACADGTPVPTTYRGHVIVLATNLQVLRDIVGAIHINSGFRTPAHNKKIGGKPKSKHLIGMAADITTRTHTPKELYDIIEGLINEGKMMQGGLELYPSFVHYDVRGTKARW